MNKIGVYAICKNEAGFVRRWVASMWCGGRGADRAYILDTGSTDGTVELFRQILDELDIPESWLKIAVKTYDSFRFDVARNNNLAMTAQDAEWLDALVSVDLDETMIEDFWPDLRRAVAEHPDFERIHYLYAWNHDDNGNPKRVFWYDKVHPVTGVKWIHPVHEELVIENINRSGVYRLAEDKIYLHHWPDNTKSRSSYLPLLEVRAEENPDDIYGLFYLMREYLFRDPGSVMALSVANIAYIKMTTSSHEDQYDCLPFILLSIGDIYDAHGFKDDAEHFFRKALEVGKHLRQPYISLASLLAYRGQHAEALQLLDQMEKLVPVKYSTWYEVDYNWTWRPSQVRAVALCWAGQYEKAEFVFEEAERCFIKTPTDIEEATANGFYDDYKWLKDYLARRRDTA